jgi:hypothetical protein
MASSMFCIVDDKYVPLYRILWVGAVPHFCGEDDCQCEGMYEVRLEQEESVWAATPQERDGVLKALEDWGGGPDHFDEPQT